MCVTIDDTSCKPWDDWKAWQIFIHLQMLVNWPVWRRTSKRIYVFVHSITYSISTIMHTYMRDHCTEFVFAMPYVGHAGKHTLFFS